jgi:hypothetical protein
MNILKTPVSNPNPQQPALSFKLDASAIIGQDIKRVTIDDAQKLENQRHNHALFEKLNLLFRSSEQETNAQREEDTLYDILSKYTYAACPNSLCPYRENVRYLCPKCILSANQIFSSISDNTITYHGPRNFIFNSGKDIGDINKFLSHFLPPIAYNLPFKKNPPNIDELKAIFYWHREWARLNSKTQEVKQISNNINYSTPLHSIHYQLAQRLLLLYHTADPIISHDDLPGQLTHLQRERDAVLKKFQIPSNLNSFFEQKLTKHIGSATHIVSNPNFTKFQNLNRILFTISNGKSDTIKLLAIMLAKIYIGRPYLEYIDKDTNHLTLIITNNPMYIRNFFMDIFLYTLTLGINSDAQKIYDEYSHHKKNATSFFIATEYSATKLSDETNIGEFIKDKNMGNIVNIDTTNTSAGSNFKDIVNGRALSYKDTYFGTLSYKSNAHYIRINETIKDNGLGDYNIPYDTILFNGDLSNAIYEPLNDYELFFLVTGFINYGLDLLSQPDLKPIVSQPAPLELVNEFIGNFCSDTTNTISPTEPNIEDETKRLDAAKELGITQLPFTHIDILAEFFNEWCAIAHNDISYEENVIKNTFIDKYPNIFYFKKRAMTPLGKSKEARGLYGLKFEYDKFIKFKNAKASSIASDQSTPEKFIPYFENILTNYFFVNKQ